MGKFLVGLAVIWVSFLWIASGLMHLWTIYIAYENSGWFGGIATLFFPVISQIVWGYNAYASSGFDSPYIQWLIVLLALWIVNYILRIVVAIIEQREENKLLIAATAETIIDQRPMIYGFGGWLYLVATGLLVAFGQSLFYLIDTLLPIFTSGKLQTISQQSPTLASALLFETVFNIYVVAITLLAAYFCFKQKKLFKKTMIIFYSLNLAFTGLSILLASIVPELDQTAMKEYINSFMRSAITVVIWVPYFLKSKRVKNTYIY